MKIKEPVDEKDLDDKSLDPPETHHTIKCKRCQHKKRVHKRYSRLCEPCRVREGHTPEYEYIVPWDTWGD